MFANLRFRHLNMLSPSVAAAAFMILLVVIQVLGHENEQRLEQIRARHIPTMHAAQQIELLATRLQRVLQEAGATGDQGTLDEAAHIRAELDQQLARLQPGAVRGPDALAALRRAIARYYDLSQRTAKALAADVVSETVVSDVTAANAAFDALMALIEKGAEHDRLLLNAAFQQAADANTALVRIATGVAVACLLALLVVALVTSSAMRKLVQEIVGVSAQINSAAAEMSAAANQHEQGAAEQVSAVEETRRTIGSLMETGDQVNAAIDVVLRNAEQTQAKNQLIGESIAKLSGTTERIGEVLETIRDIAHKSDLLALNAALEGTKAGEAGRGFSLVATQMQRLAENVMEAVVNIKTLTADVRRASGGSVLATEEGTKLAHETTRSAREIRMVMQQYQAGTAQVSTAMNDISHVGQQSALGSRQVLTGSKDLATLSERLLQVIERFRLDGGQSPPRTR